MKKHIYDASALMRFLTVAVAVVILAVSVACRRHSDGSSLKTSLAAYALEYSERLDEDARRVAEELSAPGVEDSLFYKKISDFGRNMFHRGQQYEAFEFLHGCIEILDRDDCRSEYCSNFKTGCYLMLGAASDEMGLGSLSNDYYFTGLKLADSQKSKLVGDFYNNIGVSYRKAGRNEKAREFYDKALGEALERNDKYLAYIAYSNIAELQGDSARYDAAVGNALKAMQCISEPDSPDDYFAMQTSIGELYGKKKEYPMALTYLKNAYINQKKRKSDFYLFDTCMNLAEVFSAAGLADSARVYLDEAALLTTRSENSDHRLRLMEEEAAFARETGDMANVCDIQDRMLALKDSVYKTENAARIENAHHIYQMEQTGAKLWDSPLLSPVSLAIALAALALLACVSGWLWFSRRTTSRRYASLKDAMESMVEEQNMLRLRDVTDREQMESDMKKNGQKLAIYTLDRIKISQQIEDASVKVRQAIAALGPREKDSKESLKNVLAVLSSMKSDNQWEEFQYYFERVHPDFYRTLDMMHPGLTVKDRRLCALMSLGLSTKDIADITFREVRSVESSRNRLRKKLGLDSSESLLDHILAMSHSI